jgi:hypothetical protein
MWARGLGLRVCVCVFFFSMLGSLHTRDRPRARDRYTSSTLVGGEGGAGPSSLHTTLEGPTE